MRTLFKGGFGLLLLLGVLAGYGLLTPTVSHSFEVIINRPVIPVFTKMASVNDMPQWIRGLERVEPIGFNPIPGLPVGSYNLFYAQGITSTDFRLDILDVDPLSKIRVRMSNKVMELECTAVFVPDGEQTVMQLHAVSKGTTLLARMTAPYLKGRLRSETEENIGSLKRVLEES